MTAREMNLKAYQLRMIASTLDIRALELAEISDRIAAESWAVPRATGVVLRRSRDGLAIAVEMLHAQAARIRSQAGTLDRDAKALPA